MESPAEYVVVVPERSEFPLRRACNISRPISPAAEQGGDVAVTA
jgi:hypothetical protein